MKSSLSYLGSQVVAKTKMPQLFHKLACRDELTILMYHGIIKEPLGVEDWCFVDEHSFQAQMAYLKEHFEIVALSEGVEKMRDGRIKYPTAVMTFDDGYQNNFDVAFPILHRERIPATIFLATGLMNTEDTVWYCRLNLALSQTDRDFIEWHGFKFDLSTSDLKAKASAALQESLKRFEPSQLMTTVGHLISELGNDPNGSVETGSPFRMLDQVSITEMLASGLIEFGAHTHRHTILTRLSAKERSSEIRQSIHAVTKLTGRPCRHFAYPNGRMEDYDAETIEDLKTCGVEIAVTTISGPNDRRTPVMELRRYGIGADLSMAKFQLTVHHFINKMLG